MVRASANIVCHSASADVSGSRSQTLFAPLSPAEPCSTACHSNSTLVLNSLDHGTSQRCPSLNFFRASPAPSAELLLVGHPTRRKPPKPSRNCAKLYPRFPRFPAIHWTPAFFCAPQKISRRTIHSPLRLARHASERNRTSPNTVPLRTHRESPALTQNHTHKTHT